MDTINPKNINPILGDSLNVMIFPIKIVLINLLPEQIVKYDLLSKNLDYVVVF